MSARPWERRELREDIAKINAPAIMIGRETVGHLLDKADQLDALRDAIREAWVEHASQEGAECCGAAFCNQEGAKECVVAKRFMDALDRRDLSGPVGGQ